jgi:hypothetical protein
MCPLGHVGRQSRFILTFNGRDKIRQQARTAGKGNVTFDKSYEFESVEFSHGDASVEGAFSGSVHENAGLLTISGRTEYRFSDRFTDPVDIRGFVAWIRERPNRIRRMFQLVGNLSGFRQGPLSPEVDFQPDEVYETFLKLTDLGGTAYNIFGSWSSHMEATILKDKNISKY